MLKMISFLKNNPRKTLVFFSIILVATISLNMWYGADKWAIKVQEGDGWYQYPDLSRQEVRDTYNLAFKKIVLVGGFMFGSTFLLLKVIKEKADK